MAATIEQVEYTGWRNAWRVAEGELELVVVADVGPRVMRLAFGDGENQLYEDPAQAGVCGGKEYRSYGGHRLWVAPETERTRFPDNLPCAASATNGELTVTAPVEDTGLQKTIAVRINNGAVRILHTIKNHGAETQVAPWALTVLRPGGRAILPLPKPAPWGPRHLLPETSLTLWSYTDLSLSCWRMGPEYMELEQSVVPGQAFGMQKIGMRNRDGWGAYLRNRHLFAKYSEWREGEYLDFGSSFEVFANESFIELETLGPNRGVASGASVTHVEHWSLTKNVKEGSGAEWVEANVLPIIEQLRAAAM